MDKDKEMYRYITDNWISEDKNMLHMHLYSRSRLSYKSVDREGELKHITHGIAIRIVVPKDICLFHNLVSDFNYNNKMIKDFPYDVVVCFNGKWKLIDEKLTHGHTLQDIRDDLEKNKGYHYTFEFGFLTKEEFSDYNMKNIERCHKDYEERENILTCAFNKIYTKKNNIKELYERYIIEILGTNVSKYMDFWIMDNRLQIISNFINNCVKNRLITKSKTIHQTEMELIPLTKQIIDNQNN